MTIIRILPLLTASVLGLSACSSDTPIDVTYTPAQMVIEQPPDPAPLELNRINFHVVTRDNFQKFVKDQTKVQGSKNPVFVVINMNGYKSMSLDLAELKRYIEQQQKIIVYYKNSTTATTPTE